MVPKRQGTGPRGYAPKTQELGTKVGSWCQSAIGPGPKCSWRQNTRTKGLMMPKYQGGLMVPNMVRDQRSHGAKDHVGPGPRGTHGAKAPGPQDMGGVKKMRLRSFVNLSFFLFFFNKGALQILLYFSIAMKNQFEVYNNKEVMSKLATEIREVASARSLGFFFF